MSEKLRRVVSVSLGTSKRDKSSELEILGEKFLLERIGTDGDTKRFAQMFSDLDGKVDALGVGGSDVVLVVENRRYPIKQIEKLIAGATQTPVVDGSGLKHTLERETIRYLEREGILSFRGKKVLMVAAVDRFGMAQALDEAGADIVYGDLIFGLGLPIPVRSYRMVKILGSILLPLITRLPVQWFYPTGKKQEVRSPKFPKVFADREIICGDWHYIRKYMPDDLRGKTIITQTLREDDLKLLKELGAKAAITTTPVIGGETFATNVMEGVVITLLGKRPSEVSDEEYLAMLAKLAWVPNRISLNPS